MQQTLQQTKKRDEEPGGRRGRFFYDRRHKKWHIQKAIFHSKRIYKNWKKIQKFPANASPVFQALGELGCREKQQNEASRTPTVSFSLSLSLSPSLSRSNWRFLPPADLPERDEGSTEFIQTTQFTFHPSIFSVRLNRVHLIHTIHHHPVVFIQMFFTKSFPPSSFMIIFVFLPVYVEISIFLFLCFPFILFFPFFFAT